MADYGYTVVQHSGFGYADDPQFARGLESRRLRTAGERNVVEHVGGMVFDGYAAAEDYAFAQMYPPGVSGMIPAVHGRFAEQCIDGLRIYLPRA